LWGERRERELRLPDVLSVCVKVEWDSNAILDNGKLEDLVRLALKRLNVSYLTILSRLVWFQRETFVCHKRERKETFATCFLNFWAIKFYSISLSLLNYLLINYMLSANNLIKKYLIYSWMQLFSFRERSNEFI